MQLIGFTLIRDDGVIFLEKEEKDLSKEEMQTIVILFLLVDLWMEKGKAYSDLFQVAVPWPELDWFYLLPITLATFGLLGKMRTLLTTPEKKSALALFHYSNIYLALVLMMAILATLWR